MSEQKQAAAIPERTLKSKLKNLVKNLLLMSETDAPIEIVTLDGTYDIKTLVMRESNTDDAQITEIAFDEFFDKYGVVKDWQDVTQKDFARKFGEALNLLKNNIQDVKIFRAGGVKADIYIIGQVSSTRWTGMKTLVVET